MSLPSRHPFSPSLSFLSFYMSHCPEHCSHPVYPPSPFNSTLPPVCLTDTLHINRSEKKKKKPITSLPLKSLLPQSILQTFPASFPSLLFSAPLLCSVDFLSSGHNIQTVKSLGAHTPSLLTHMSFFPLPSLHHLLNFHTNIQ